MDLQLGYSTINRMYYACFHTVFVLLIKMVLFRLSMI
jgi:uncharacterized protein (UPF0332 family)